MHNWLEIPREYLESAGYRAQQLVADMEVGESITGLHPHRVSRSVLEPMNCAEVVPEKADPQNREPVTLTKLYSPHDTILSDENAEKNEIPFVPDGCSGCIALGVLGHCFILQNYQNVRRDILESLG